MRKVIAVSKQKDSDLLRVLLQYAEGQLPEAHYMKEKSVKLIEMKTRLVEAGKITEQELEDLAELVLEANRESHYCENEGGCCL